MKLCRTCHSNYGVQPDMFQAFLLSYLGEEKLDILQHLKLFQWPDLKFTVGEMKQIGELPLMEVLTMYRDKKGAKI